LELVVFEAYKKNPNFVGIGGMLMASFTQQYFGGVFALDLLSLNILSNNVISVKMGDL
jgi:hypothetical protein